METLATTEFEWFELETLQELYLALREIEFRERWYRPSISPAQPKEAWEDHTELDDDELPF